MGRANPHVNVQPGAGAALRRARQPARARGGAGRLSGRPVPAGRRLRVRSAPGRARRSSGCASSTREWIRGQRRPLAGRRLATCSSRRARWSSARASCWARSSRASSRRCPSRRPATARSTATPRRSPTWTASIPSPHERDAERLMGVEASRVVFGHTHLQFTRGGPGGIELVNPGSVGMPLDGDRRAAYAIVARRRRASSCAAWTTTGRAQPARCASAIGELPAQAHRTGTFRRVLVLPSGPGAPLQRPRPARPRVLRPVRGGRRQHPARRRACSRRCCVTSPSATSSRATS